MTSWILLVENNLFKHSKWERMELSPFVEEFNRYCTIFSVAWLRVLSFFTEMVGCWLTKNRIAIFLMVIFNRICLTELDSDLKKRPISKVKILPSIQNNKLLEHCFRKVKERSTYNLHQQTHEYGLCCDWSIGSNRNWRLDWRFKLIDNLLTWFTF